MFTCHCYLESMSCHLQIMTTLWHQRTSLWPSTSWICMGWVNSPWTTTSSVSFGSHGKTVRWRSVSHKCTNDPKKHSDSVGYKTKTELKQKPLCVIRTTEGPSLWALLSLHRLRAKNNANFGSTTCVCCPFICKTLFRYKTNANWSWTYVVEQRTKSPFVHSCSFLQFSCSIFFSILPLSNNCAKIHFQLRFSLRTSTSLSICSYQRTEQATCGCQVLWSCQLVFAESTKCSAWNEF